MPKMCLQEFLGLSVFIRLAILSNVLLVGLGSLDETRTMYDGWCERTQLK